MEVQFVFTKNARKKFLSLEKKLQTRIQQKLLGLKQRPHIESTLIPLTDFRNATHRLRIGDYRIILKKRNSDVFIVVDLGHRRDVYRRGR